MYRSSTMASLNWLPLYAVAFIILSILGSSESFTPSFHRDLVTSQSKIQPSNFQTPRPSLGSTLRAPSIVSKNALCSTNDAAVESVETNIPIDQSTNPCQVLLLDHLNINHEKSRHDLLNAFYFDFLKCAIDPRKYENYESGKETVWANIGMHQFHLPEGKLEAQVLEGVITLVYNDLGVLLERYTGFLNGGEELRVLEGTQFNVETSGEALLVTDPWGNQFKIVCSDDPVADRAADIGSQPLVEGHAPSEGLAMRDITIYVPHGTSLAGIGRFYDYVLGAPTVDLDEGKERSSSISIAVGPRQTLTFQYNPSGSSDDICHHDFSYDSEEKDNSLPLFPSNHGPHISLYITDLPHAYNQASNLGVLYVNPRFKRRAYSKEDAVDQCMFRIIDIVDPLDEGDEKGEKNVILRLEHEVRAVKTKDGKKYKSCPLLEIPI